MQNKFDNLRIRRTCNCDQVGEPTIEILLLSVGRPIMQYAAKSLTDAIRYEEETLRALREGDEALSVVFEDLSQCSECERREKCMKP